MGDMEQNELTTTIALVIDAVFFPLSGVKSFFALIKKARIKQSSFFYLWSR